MAANWQCTTQATDWYAEQFPESRPTSDAQSATAPKIAPTQPGRGAAVARYKRLQRFILSSLRSSGLFGARFVAATLRTAFRVAQFRVVQCVILLLLLVAAAFGAYTFLRTHSDRQPGGPLNPAASCRALHKQRPALPSGAYWVDPPGAVLAERRPFRAYCDMVTDGGGWTLVLAYNHDEAAQIPLDGSHWPLDPLTGYSHAFHWNNHAQRNQYATEARFYCQSTAHPRKMHFKITDTGLLRAVMANTGYVCTMDVWRQKAELLEGHTAHLPRKADSCWNGMLHHPFFKSHRYHWNIRYGTEEMDAFRWECDDLSGDDASTLHQIWVR